MLDDEILIRLAEEGLAFIYTIGHEGAVIESAAVECEDPVAPGYYGGSEAMD